jgi:hypothetical protein
MAAKLSALCAGRTLPPGFFFMLLYKPISESSFYALLSLLASSFFVVSCLVYSSPMKTEAVRFSKRRKGTRTWTTQRHIQHVTTGISVLLFAMAIHYELKAGDIWFRFHWRVNGNFDRVGRSFPDRETCFSHAASSRGLSEAGLHNE